jgi:hypothetical protein
MNCSYIFDNSCYDESIDNGNYIIRSLLFVSFLAIPVYCAIKYCQIKKQNYNNKIILIPGYVHIDPTNVDSPPEYKDNINPERIV